MCPLFKSLIHKNLNIFQFNFIKNLYENILLSKDLKSFFLIISITILIFNIIILYTTLYSLYLKVVKNIKFILYKIFILFVYFISKKSRGYKLYF